MGVIIITWVRKDEATSCTENITPLLLLLSLLLVLLLVLLLLLLLEVQERPVELMSTDCLLQLG